MITTARQLKDLVRNLSNKKSSDAQILMRNYMMERLKEEAGRRAGIAQRKQLQEEEQKRLAKLR